VTAVGGITSGLRRRLLVMLIAPLMLLALLNAWFDYRSADGQAVKQDQQLLALVPLLADSVIAQGSKPGDLPVLLLAPAPSIMNSSSASRPWPARSSSPWPTAPTRASSGRARCC
jgi:hypothetical protein